ncbi:hypothetical protein KY338_00805 [Candidatus Woesearchaeota archaeon]|nr:hypothetical protein [Candidatus Woesearchaeota archaeon]
MKKILLTTAGGGNANNIVRGLKATNLDLEILGTNISKRELVKSLTEKNFIVPRYSDPDYIEKLNKIIESEKIDFLIVNHEQEAKKVSENIDKIKCKTFIPSFETIKLCIDKLRLSKIYEKAGVPVARTISMDEVTDLKSDIEKLKNKPDDFVWCRIKEGAGSRGAAPFKEAAHIEFWIDYWKKNKGAKRSDFILHEYLPGRDYHFFSIWNKGELVIGKTCERLEYVAGKYTLSGTSSSPSVGRQVYNKAVIETCIKAVKTIDENAQGIFAIDLKENVKGEPCICEINIARFPRINIFFSMTGKYNMTEIFVRLGLGEDVGITNITEDIEENKFLFRDVDNEPSIVSEKEMEECCK